MAGPHPGRAPDPVAAGPAAAGPAAGAGPDPAVRDAGVRWLVASAVVRRGDDVLLVEQEQGWTLPGGMVEPGEEVVRALVREVAEETGLRVLAPTALAYTNHHLTAAGRIVAHVFAATAEPGAIAVADPDAEVRSAAWVPLPAAVDRLRAWPIRTMSEPAVAHLTGAAPPGTLWSYADVDGVPELVARIP